MHVMVLKLTDMEYQGACTFLIAYSQIKVKVILRPMVSQSVLVSDTHLGPSTKCSPSFFNYF
jgi:hypothetical protein